MSASPRQKRLLTAAATAVAFGIAMYWQAPDDGSAAVLGSFFVFVAMVVGLAAAAQVRPLPARSIELRARLMGLSLLAGVALGLVNLLINYGIAHLDPAIYAEMIAQWPKFSFWSVAVTGPFAEEIGFRLVLMSGVAWLVSRFTRDRRIIFGVALAIATILFGVAHILPGSRPTASVLHATLVAIKSGVLGAALGLIFWRNGLPYSAACHGLANAVHLVAWPMLFEVTTGG